MGDAEKFCLRWNDFESNISGAFRELREDKDFFDVTLACDDDQMQAHKVILSACSPFFRTILRRNRHEHPLLYLKGVKYTDLVSVLNFMYHGEVNVAQEELNSFLAVAEDLKVKGLTQSSADTKQQSSFKPEPLKTRPRDPPVRAEPPPPPKRPRPVHQSAPRPAPTTYHHEEDIQEVVPVKSEPAPHPPENQTHMHSLAPAYAAAQDEQMAGVVADPNMEYGEEYGDYGGYDDAEESYNTSGMTVDGQDGNTDIDELVQSSMAQVIGEGGGTTWQCNHCGKQDKMKINLSRHVESHFSFSHTCPYCAKVYKSRPSLKFHMATKHKD